MSDAPRRGARRPSTRVRDAAARRLRRDRSRVCKVASAGIELEAGFVYLLDGDGDLARVSLRGPRVGRPRKLRRLGVAREPGFLYFVDRDGDVARVPVVSS